ncbi:putative mitogen-activated protein kinase kinase kinase 7-like [Taenia crassiceps]|uniref:Mitogen-activated protein kinase kinase kinase 7-like n=1 Tax=Taenia crassiceps TaxID=6207 RepID=A0ABR4Q1A8_9CEST
MDYDKPVPKYSCRSFQKQLDDELRSYKEKIKSINNITEEEIQIERKSVSGGSFGDVSFGTYRGKNVVKKDFRNMTTSNDRKYNYRETCTLATCNHQNIVKFIGAGPNTQMAELRYVVIERASNASLAELIHSTAHYSIWHVMLWNLHLADGLEYLHSRSEPIIHRDLKPANMLLFDGCTTLKISDFGSSKIFEAGKEELQSVNQGSRLYMAPEVQQRRADENYTWYTEKVDIYSMMVSMWEMVTRTLEQNVNPHTTMIQLCPPFLKRLIDCGMALDPDQRPSASQLVGLLDFIMRKVCTKTTSQLYIDFECGEIPSLYQQAHTYPVNSNSDSLYASVSDEGATVRFSDSVEEVAHGRKTPGDGRESPLYATFELPKYQRMPSDGMSRNYDFKEIPQLLRPICPTNSSESVRKLYQRHVEVAEEYVRLSEELKRLRKQWDEKVAQIIRVRSIPPWQVDNYKKSIKDYCELYATMWRYLERAKYQRE